MRMPLILLSCLIVTGCAAEELRKQKEALGQAVALCKAGHPAARGTMVARTQCIAEARTAFFDNTGNKDGDLEAVLEADALVNAIKVDNGTMSVPEYTAAMAHETVDLNSQREARQQQRARTAAAIMAAMPAPAPAPVLPTPTLYTPPAVVTCDSRALVPGLVQTTCQ